MMKSINTSQTIRFILDGTFTQSSPVITSIVQSVVEQCPTLRNKFIGVPNQIETEDMHEGTIDYTSSILHNCTLGKPIPARNFTKEEQASLLQMVDTAYKKDQGFGLEGMKCKVKYWGLFSGTKSKCRAKRYRVRIDDFLSLRNDSIDCLYRLKIIISVSVGTLCRVFFGIRKLTRDSSQEISAAPYKVYSEDTDIDIFFVGISRIEGEDVHFVSKGTDCWWHNPFVTNFL